MKCTTRNRRGIRCGADAMKGSRLCFMHSPKTASAARDARRLGGQNRALALRPPVVLVAEPGTALAPAPAAPPAWWKLETKPDVLEALRDVGRATIARKLDPRSADTVIQVLRELLADHRELERERKAERRAKREWARSQLRDRLDALREELTAARSMSDLHRLENQVEYIESLVRRAHLTPGGTSLAVRTP